jgi:hypothetical protein
LKTSIYSSLKMFSAKLREVASRRDGDGRTDSQGICRAQAAGGCMPAYLALTLPEWPASGGENNHHLRICRVVSGGWGAQL